MKEVEYIDWSSLQIGDIIKHPKEDKIEIVITSLDNQFLIDNEVDVLMGCYNCRLFRNERQ